MVRGLGQCCCLDVEPVLQCKLSRKGNLGLLECFTQVARGDTLNVKTERPRINFRCILHVFAQLDLIEYNICTTCKQSAHNYFVVLQ